LFRHPPYNTEYYTILLVPFLVENILIFDGKVYVAFLEFAEKEQCFLLWGERRGLRIAPEVVIRLCVELKTLFF
jgi:hypothetical protein